MGSHEKVKEVRVRDTLWVILESEHFGMTRLPAAHLLVSGLVRMTASIAHLDVVEGWAEFLAKCLMRRGCECCAVGQPIETAIPFLLPVLMVVFSKSGDIDCEVRLGDLTGSQECLNPPKSIQPQKWLVALSCYVIAGVCMRERGANY
jgi:hypothetical protein